jgi:transcriptional regulator with XRE-family HTH domain
MKRAEIDPDYIDLMMQIGEQIKELRKKRGISYTEMAEEIGISRNGYNNIELAKSNFQFLTLLRILKYHDVSVFQFFESLKH